MLPCPHLKFDHIMNENLKAAAEADSTDQLYRQIQVDPYALERIDAIPFIHTPLHIAAKAGNISFATEILRLKPSFAWKLNEHGLSPMHLALENPNFSIVRQFIHINKDGIRVKGKDGLTPLHSAIEAGNVELLAEILTNCPESIEDVTIHSETPLHVAVKNEKFEALKFLLCWLLSNCKKGALDLQMSVLNWKDKDDNTILHTLVGQNNIDPQIVRLLIQGKINLNAKNRWEKTAVDIVKEQNQSDVNIVRIKKILLGANALSSDLVPSAPTLAETLVKEVTPNNGIKWTKIKFNRFRESITNDTRNILLVVAVLVATSTNQAALSPPGGVYQSEANDVKNSSIHMSLMDIKQPGTSVMDSFSFNVFFAYNTLAILASALAIYILLPPAGGLTLLLVITLFYFVVGFFFSMSIVRPFGVVSDLFYWPVIIILGELTIAFIIKLAVPFLSKKGGMKSVRGVNRC